MAASTLTSKGQITIPRDVRERLGLKEGDRLVFHFDEKGNLLIRPESEGPLGRLPGLLGHLAKQRPVSLEEMNDAVKRRAAVKFRRAAEE